MEYLCFGKEHKVVYTSSFCRNTDSSLGLGLQMQVEPVELHWCSGAEGDLHYLVIYMAK